MEKHQLYVNLGRLVEAIPNLTEFRIGIEARQWLARACALVQASGQIVDSTRLVTLMRFLSEEGDADYAREAMDIVFRALAVAELNSPEAVSGAFIAVGNHFDAMVAVGKVLGSANTTLAL
jgi:hypothetical protein